MKVFDTIPKKLAILVFVLFEVGWIVYTVGFGLVLDGKPSTLLAPTDIKNLFYFPFYFTLVSGQFMVVLGLLHAALPSSRASAIIGVFSTILNHVCFASIGFVLVYCGQFIVLLLENASESRPGASLILMFAGTFLLAVSWIFSQIFAIFYKKPQQTRTRNWWVLTVDIYKALVGDAQVCGSIGRLFTRTEMIHLLSIPAVVLSAIGWSVYAGGLYNLNQALASAGGIDLLSNNFAVWGSSIITPIAFLIALLHAGSSGNQSDAILGVLLSILNTFISVCVGYVVTFMGQALHTIDSLNFRQLDPFTIQLIRNINLTLGGGIVCLLFWTFVLVLSQFYTYSASTTNSTSIDTPGDQQLPLSYQDATLQSNIVTQSKEQLIESGQDHEQPSTVQYEKKVEVISIPV